MSRVGEVLVHQGAVSSAGLRRALTFQRYGGQRLRLGTILVGWNLADEETLLEALSRHHGAPSASWLELSRASPETASLLPAEIAEQVRAIPFKEELRGVRVAFANPSDIAAVDRAASVVRRRVIPVVALEIRILQAQDQFYGSGIPPDHRPILFKLRDADESPPPPRASTATSRVIPIRAKPDEAAPVEELVEEEVVAPPTPPAPSASPAPRPPVPADQTRPMAVRPTPATAPAPDGSDPVAGFWLTDAEASDEPPPEGPPEDLTDPEPTPSSGVSEAAALPRPARDQVAATVLASLLPGLPRLLVFGSDKEHLFGVFGRGMGVPTSEVQRIHLAPADGSILQRVRESRAPHFGKPVQELWPGPLAMLVGLDPPACAVFPLENVNGFVGLLYADRCGDRMRNEDFGELTRAAAFLANALGSSQHQD